MLSAEKCSMSIVCFSRFYEGGGGSCVPSPPPFRDSTVSLCRSVVGRTSGRGGICLLFITLVEHYIEMNLTHFPVKMHVILYESLLVDAFIA